MKLGIAMLVTGLIFAGFGVFLGSCPGSYIWFQKCISYEYLGITLAVGKGMTVFGGGLSLGGLVRMTVKR